MEKKLYKFYWDCGRMGNVEGVFVSTQNLVDEAIGKQVYLGEVLGKHSEIYGPLEVEDIEPITDDQSVIDMVLKYNLEQGFNPLHYINSDETEEDEDEE